MHDTEDKSWWVNEGEKFEGVFVGIIAPTLKIDAVINPEKENNPYAPDLIVEGLLSDLKYQSTPFFMAHSRYGIPNQYAVTFNRKDFVRYGENYPDIRLYYWIDWKELQKEIGGIVYEVEPMQGIFQADFQYLKSEIETGKAPLHTYQRRVEDTWNGRDSYVFDVRKFKILYISGSI